ncbi:protein phosphatase [Streptomyces sp. NTH33]|uniref:PP2C family protein-serine/threonine phosphatase n=1 Tax=Streptomyces sp. NTH33 TaxID=1735453 RepID=UPI000DA78D91|nr:PP2C family protein-serine/threonine phosphatase [Streptomyces sp. NTH33]PZG82165.1 protein phosphatase [Streptomyces sp. NTH33]
MRTAWWQKGVVVDGDLVSGPGSAAANRFVRADRALSAIGTTLDDRRTAAELAAFLVEELCDSATVDLYGPQEGHREPGESLRPAAAAGRHDLLGSLERGPREEVAVRALDAGHPITASFTPGRSTGLATLSVPLLTRDRVHGVVLALRAGRPFDDDETAAVHYAARLAAAHLRHADDQREAGPRVWDLQKVLSAGPGRSHPDVDLATRWSPGPVGGHWCEAVRLHSGRTLLVAGDVMGHGLDAAVDMNAYRSLLRYIASTDLAPHGILRRLDAAMSTESGRRPATCLLVLLDPVHGTALLAGAGHPPPVVVHADGTAAPVELPVGPPLGTGGSAYRAAGLPLAPDDTLVMFTYGLIERRGEDIDTSLARLTALRVRPGQGVGELLDELLDEVPGGTPGGPGAGHTDDGTAVVAARLRPRP